MTSFMKNTKTRILINTLSGWGSIGIQALIGFFTLPILIGKLGKEGYGAIIIIWTIVGLSDIADFGLRAALNRELSEKVVKNDAPGFLALSSSAITINLILAIPVISLLYFFAPYLVDLFGVQHQYKEVTLLLLRTYAPFSILISFVAPVLNAGICSFMRYDITNKIQAYHQISSNITVLALFTVIKSNLIILCCTTWMVFDFLRLLVIFYCHRNICYRGSIRIGSISRNSLRSFFHLGFNMYLLSITRLLAQRIDPLIISHFLGLSGITIYNAGVKISQMVTPAIMNATNQLFPLTTKYHINNHIEQEQKVLILGTRYTMHLASVACAAMIIFADSFSKLWLYDKIQDDTITVALIIKLCAIVSIFNYAGGSQWAIILGKKRMKFALWINIPTSIMNACLSYYLVGHTNMGVAGVLIGTIISEIFRRIVSIVYVARITRLNPITYITKSYVTPVLYFALLLISGHYLACSTGCSIDNWVEFLLKIAVFLLFAGVLLAFIEWNIIKSGYRKAVAKIKQ